MNFEAFDKAEISSAVERAPAIGPVLKKLAQKIVKGLTLPDTFSVRNLDYAARGELERIFGAKGQTTSDGRFAISILPFFKEPGIWQGVVDFYGLESEKNNIQNVFERLRLLHPYANDFIDDLQSNDEIKRFLRKTKNVRDWVILVQGVIRRRRHQSGQVTTLSQLGSDWFGDSKKLRSGPLRRQMIIILAILSDCDPEDETLVLNGALIYDNPYTSCVTFSAPVELCLKRGVLLDYPVKYYEMGMAVQLPLETVLEIENVEWCGDKYEVTTSENAAPFAMMVQHGLACVYTAGYPNLAVKVMLNKISQCGVKCVHVGDADLDGFRIASEVAKCIPVARTIATDVLRAAAKEAGIKLTLEQFKRIRSHLESPKWEEFPYNDDIRKLLELGSWFEQESFGRI